MAVTFPQYVTQQMDRGALNWMNQVRGLLNEEQYETLCQQTKAAAIYFGSWERPVFLYSGATFCPIRALLRELFSSNRQTDAEILMSAVADAKLVSPAVSFYALAIQAIKGADLTVLLKKYPRAVEKMLTDEKQYFLDRSNKGAVQRLGYLQKKFDEVQAKA